MPAANSATVPGTRSQGRQASHVTHCLGPSWGNICTPGASEGYLGASWGHLGASRGHLGTILGPSWALLGRLGASWCHLGQFLCPLGAVLGRLGAVLGPSWGYLGRSLLPSDVAMKLRPPKSRICDRVVEKRRPLLMLLGSLDRHRGRSWAILGIGGGPGGGREPLR